MDFSGRVLIKLEEMNKYLAELEKILPSQEEYLQNLTVRRACEKTIELAIEGVIDTASIIVSQKKLGVPSSEDDILSILEKSGVLSKSLANQVREMKGFRDIIVHKYGEVDDKKSYAYLSDELEDFVLFDKEVKQFLKK
jgi:uncharacterized protein YutE (UPF0331/DUF86 family)